MREGTPYLCTAFFSSRVGGCMYPRRVVRVIVGSRIRAYFQVLLLEAMCGLLAEHRPIPEAGFCGAEQVRQGEHRNGVTLVTTSRLQSNTLGSWRVSQFVNCGVSLWLHCILTPCIILSRRWPNCKLFARSRLRMCEGYALLPEECFPAHASTDRRYRWFASTHGASLTNKLSCH